MMLWINRPGVTRRNFDRIQEGMNWKQVQDVFDGEKPVEVFGRIRVSTAIWRGIDSAEAEITFRDDRVVHKEWTNCAMVMAEKAVHWIHP